MVNYEAAFLETVRWKDRAERAERIVVAARAYRRLCALAAQGLDDHIALVAQRKDARAALFALLDASEEGE